MEEYEDLVASNIQFTSQSVNENDLAIDQERIELSFPSIFEVVLLEEYNQ